MDRDRAMRGKIRIDQIVGSPDFDEFKKAISTLPKSKQRAILNPGEPVPKKILEPHIELANCRVFKIRGKNRQTKAQSTTTVYAGSPSTAWSLANEKMSIESMTEIGLPE